MSKSGQKGAYSANMEAVAAKLRDAFEIDSVDQAILDVIAKNPSISQEQIAQAIGFSRNGIAKRMGRESFKNALKVVQMSFFETLSVYQLKAVKKLGEHLDDPDPNISLKAARALLTPLGQVTQTDQKCENVVYAVRFGEGGQLIRGMRPMNPQEIADWNT